MIGIRLVLTAVSRSPPRSRSATFPSNRSGWYRRFPLASERRGRPDRRARDAGAPGQSVVARISAVPGRHARRPCGRELTARRLHVLLSPSPQLGTQPVLYKLGFDPLRRWPGRELRDRQADHRRPPGVHSNARNSSATPSQSGTLNYGAPIGIGPHFLMELFKIKSGARIQHVPYRGSGPIITDVIAGQIQLMMAGKVRVCCRWCSRPACARSRGGIETLGELPRSARLPKLATSTPPIHDLRIAAPRARLRP